MQSVIGTPLFVNDLPNACTVVCSLYDMQAITMLYGHITCNSLLTGLPKSRISAIQSVLNAAARYIAHLPKFTHMSTYMTEVLHWLPIASRINYLATKGVVPTP